MENVHTYRHARRVLKSQSQPQPLRYQTYLWPNATPSECDVPDYIPSEFGPPVRTPADFIALRYLSQHHPSALKCRTELVMSSISDKEFEKLDAKYAKPKKEKRSLVACLKARYPNAQIPSSSDASPSKVKCDTTPPVDPYFIKYGKPISSNFWKSTRSNRKRLSPIIHIPSMSVLNDDFEITEELIISPVPKCFIVESIVEPAFEVVEEFQPVCEVPFICSVESSPTGSAELSPTIAQKVSCDDTSIVRPVESSQTTCDDKFDSAVVEVSFNPWSKGLLMRHFGTNYGKHRIARIRRLNRRVIKFSVVERNYKKRRRCEY